MRADVLAIGTELLLGQIVDTNSSWIGEQLAAVGIDTMEHRKVGDNLGRMVAALREMLDEADAVIVCGGLGPTQDDVTREAIAEVMGVELERREDLVEHIARCSAPACRDMPAEQPAPGRRARGRRRDPEPDRHRARARGAEVGGKVVYAVPGVPYEMQQMVTEHVLPDLLARSGERGGDRVALAEDVGHVGVGPGRDDRRPGRRADATRRSRSSPGASRASSCA